MLDHMAAGFPRVYSSFNFLHACNFDLVLSFQNFELRHIVTLSLILFVL